MQKIWPLKICRKSAIREMLNKSRKKKKNYIETLEKKVADLEYDLQSVRSDLAKYKAREQFYQTGDNSGFIELTKTQEVLKNKGHELFSNTKDSSLQCLSYLSAT